MTAPKKPASPLPIGKAEIETFLESDSDFSFEMSVLHKLNSKLGFSCFHGGTYVDPVTKKYRQFDIRGLKPISDSFHLWVAVECKNLKATAPLLVHIAPRGPTETGHFLLSHSEFDPNKSYPAIQGPMNVVTRVLEVEIEQSVYRVNEFVGKSMDQPSYDGTGKFRRSDYGVFEKFDQALSSMSGVISLALHRRRCNARDAFLPFLVVPDGMLWTVGYAADGRIAQRVQNVDHIQYYVGRFLESPNKSILAQYFPLTHFEIVTESGLEMALTRYFGSEEKIASFFGNRGAREL